MPRANPMLRASPAFLALLLSSCWSPAFDSGLADAASAARGMAGVADLRVEGIKERSATQGLFLPRRAAAPLDGIWFQGYGDTSNTYNLITPYYIANGQASEWLSVPASPFGSVPDRPLVALSPATAQGGPLEAAGLTGKEAWWATGRLYEPSDAPRTVRLDTAIGDSIGEALLLGVGFRAASRGLDELTVIHRDNASGTWRLAAFSYSSGLPAMILASHLEPPPEALAEPFGAPGYAARIGGTAYLSLRRKDGSVATYRWPAGPAAVPERLPGIAYPLSAALSDGTLLARDGSFLRAFGPDGEARYSLRLGSLRLAHERWDEASASFVAAFVGQSFAPTSGGQGTLRLQVFEKPTKELAALADSLD